MLAPIHPQAHRRSPGRDRESGPPATDAREGTIRNDCQAVNAVVNGFNAATGRASAWK